jgi:hypothetical protein
MSDESYEYLVVLSTAQNEKEIQTVYEGKYNRKLTTETNTLTITFEGEPTSIYSSGELTNPLYLLLIKEDDILKEVYQGTLFTISGNIITFSDVVEAKQTIREINTNKGNNDILCSVFDKTRGLINEITQLSDKAAVRDRVELLKCIPYEQSVTPPGSIAGPTFYNNNYYVNVIALVDLFIILVKMIIYDRILIKLVSMNKEYLKEITTFSDPDSENVINIKNIGDLINNIVAYTVDVNNINKVLTEKIPSTINLYKDQNSNVVLLNTNAPYIVDFIKNLFILRQNIHENYKDKSDGGALLFLNTISEIVVKNISTYVEKLNKIYTIDSNNAVSINQFIRLIQHKDTAAKIDTQYIEDSNSRLITYIKINNTESKTVINALDSGKNKYYKYNERFNILLGTTSPTTSMIVQYNSHPIKYYKDDLVSFNQDIIDYQNKNQKYYETKQIPIKDITAGEITKYDYTYTYGHFSKIFTPNQSNESISTEMKEVISSIDTDNPKPVFIIGYGSSGAGKTSSLIYYNKGEGKQKDGVLVWLLKQLCGTGRYNKVEFYIKEFDVYHTNAPVRTPEDVDDKIVYNYDGGDFKIDTSNDAIPKINEYISGDKKRNKYRTAERKKLFVMSVLKDGSNKEEPAMGSTKITINADTNIGDILIHLIDTNRFVKATTNNPNSSRSHVVVYVKLTHSGKPDAKPGYLYIGDFAGVETKFNCGDFGSVQRFLNIPRDNEKNTDGTPMKKPTRYYNTEPTEKMMKDKYQDTDYKFGGAEYDATIGLTEEYIQRKLDEFDRKGGNVKIKFSETGKYNELFLSAKYMFKRFFPGFPENQMNLKNVISQIINFKRKASNNAVSSEYNKMHNNYKGKKIIDIAKTVEDRLYDINEYLEGLKELELINVDEKVNSFVNNLLNTNNGITIGVPVNVSVTMDTNLVTKFQGILNVNNDNVITLLKDILGTKPDSGWNVSNNIFSCRTNGVTIKEIRNGLVDNMKQEFVHKIGNYMPPVSSSNPNTLFNFLVDDKSQSNAVEKKEYGFKEKVYLKDTKINIVFGEPNTPYKIDYILNYGLYNKKTGDVSLPVIYIGTVTITVPPTSPTEKIEDVLLQNSKEILNSKNKKIKEENKTRQTNRVTKQIEKNGIIEELNKNYDILYKLYEDTKSIYENDGYTFEDMPPKKLKNNFSTAKKGNEEFIKLLDKISRLQIFINHIIASTDIRSVSPGFADFLDHVYQKYEKGKKACENREKEGDYINSSLSDIRKTIDEMMAVKNQGRIVVPAFIYDCYDSYCPAGVDCFTPPTVSPQNSQIPSPIFQTIYDDIVATDKTAFYKDLLVCLFCVFNIARSTNNPPTSRYIDINELKHFLKTNGKTFTDKDEPKDGATVMQNFKGVIDRIEKNLFFNLSGVIPWGDNMQQRGGVPKSKKKENAYKKQIANRAATAEEIERADKMLKNKKAESARKEEAARKVAEAARVAAEEAAIQQVSEKETTRKAAELAKKAKKAKEAEAEAEAERKAEAARVAADLEARKAVDKKKAANIDTNNLLHIITENNKKVYIKDDININVVEGNNSNIVTFNAIAEYVKQIKLVENIDNYNAASTIGTLEYADRFAKMNLVNNSCTSYNTTKIKGGDTQIGYRELDHQEYYSK